MSPRKRKSLTKKAEEWKTPLSGIEDIVEEIFDMLPSEFFGNTIIPFVMENEEHLFYKLFLEMMRNSGNDYKDLEEYLDEKQHEFILFEYREDEIPHLWQKIIYKFICDEFPY